MKKGDPRNGDSRLTERKRGTPPKTFPPCRVKVQQVREVGESGRPVAPHYVVHLRSYPRLSFGKEQHSVDDCHDGRSTLDACVSWLSMEINVVRNLLSRYRLTGHQRECEMLEIIAYVPAYRNPVTSLTSSVAPTSSIKVSAKAL